MGLFKTTKKKTRPVKEAQEGEAPDNDENTPPPSNQEDREDGEKHARASTEKDAAGGAGNTEKIKKLTKKEKKAEKKELKKKKKRKGKPEAEPLPLAKDASDDQESPQDDEKEETKSGSALQDTKDETVTSDRADAPKPEPVKSGDAHESHRDGKAGDVKPVRRASSMKVDALVEDVTKELLDDDREAGEKGKEIDDKAQAKDNDPENAPSKTDNGDVPAQEAPKKSAKVSSDKGVVGDVAPSEDPVKEEEEGEVRPEQPKLTKKERKARAKLEREKALEKKEAVMKAKEIAGAKEEITAEEAVGAMDEAKLSRQAEDAKSKDTQPVEVPNDPGRRNTTESERKDSSLPQEAQLTHHVTPPASPRQRAASAGHGQGDPSGEVNVDRGSGREVNVDRGSGRDAEILPKPRREGVPLRQRYISKGQKGLMTAVQQDDSEMLEWILRQPGFDKEKALTVCTSNGYKALHIAVREGLVENARILLAHGADPNARTMNQWKSTALHHASAKANVPLMEVLISFGARVDIKTTEGLTPLHYAAYKGTSEAVQLLVDNDAQVNEETKRNWTPLHYAAWENNKLTVKVLLDNLADTRRQNDKGQRAHEVPGTRKEIVKMIEGHVVDPEEINRKHLQRQKSMRENNNRLKISLQKQLAMSKPGGQRGDGLLDCPGDCTLM